MALPVKHELAAMEATSVAEIPVGEGWQYEPKWDGFRCLVFREGADVELRSKAGQPLARYFPDVVAAVLALEAKCFVLDGELVIPTPDGNNLSFDALLQRIHPAASRVKKLAQETPAWLVAFDLLVTPQGDSLLEAPLRERRPRLEAFAKKYFPADGTVRLSPSTTKLGVAKKWFGSVGATLDGIIAKKLEAPYAAGERGAMVKIKARRTADCVVGGFRYAEKERVVGSLLLGLYDDVGVLHHVSFCSGLKAAEKPELTKKLEALRGGRRFYGPRSGRSEPLEHQAFDGVGGITAETRRRGAVRPRNRRALSAWDDPVTMASRQGPPPVYDGTIKTDLVAPAPVAGREMTLRWRRCYAVERPAWSSAARSRSNNSA